MAPIKQEFPEPLSLPKWLKVSLWAIASLGLAASVLYARHLHVRTFVTEPCEITEEISPSPQTVYKIESIDQNRHRAFIKGWAIIPGVLFHEQRSGFLLRELPSGQYYRMRTFAYLREDIADIYSPGKIEYPFRRDMAGLAASVDLEKLKRGTDYEIMLRYDNGRRSELIGTGRIIRRDDR